ncbi:hypothetical protein LRR81_10035 [Metabacillus sp. GX 13764]|uniref:hypothetical protein n=1 Tax=Metabacillus kandeliae TaxID=2900151 RepID=UPI001E5626F0|nr:hypothetical protein [Metabacillus kandeliae]MCD7034579.1 hypothetical protein [Metabacillus kandeliae]
MNWFVNLVTFGAAGRVEEKVILYNELYARYKKLFDEAEMKKEELNSTFETLIKQKVLSVKSLKKMRVFTKHIMNSNFVEVERSNGMRSNSTKLTHINNTLSSAHAALYASGGLSAGLGTAVGAWALVSNLGFASTGAWIGGLSGVAATNSTLAWFGGGALAAGGGGILAGTAVLGGLFAIPAIAITGWLSHKNANKKIEELEKSMNEINLIMPKLKEEIKELDELKVKVYEPAKALILELTSTTTLLEYELKRRRKQVYRMPMISRLIKIARKSILKKNYFSQKDMTVILPLIDIADHLSALIDTKLLNVK